MKICIIGKFPPIEGGVSRQTYWTAYALAKKGNKVWVVTNSDEVESRFRMVMTSDDKEKLNLNFSNGGFLKTISSETPDKKFYIPWVNPSVTKLCSLATEVVSKNKCDLIYSYYFEPYAVAGYLVSTFTNKPLIVRHAGSDIGRLIQRQDLGETYKEILKRTNLIVTNEKMKTFFSEIGISSEKLFLGFPNSLPTEFFNSKAEKINLNKIKTIIENNNDIHTFYKSSLKKVIKKEIPTIGIYGKINIVKGSFDLLKALKTLKDKKIKFQLIGAVSGWENNFDEFIDAIKKFKLEKNVWLIPFIPHWKIPNLMASTNIVCFLEREFPIKIHTPFIPREILASGKCLVLSKEIYEKQTYKDLLKDRENFILIENPKNISELSGKLEWLINNMDKTKKIGRNGYLISQKIENFSNYVDKVDSLFKTFKKMIIKQ